MSSCVIGCTLRSATSCSHNLHAFTYTSVNWQLDSEETRFKKYRYILPGAETEGWDKGYINTLISKAHETLGERNWEEFLFP